MTGASLSAAPLSMGGVIRETFAVLRRDGLRFAPLVALTVGLPSSIGSGLGLASETSTSFIAVLIVLALTLASIVGATICQAAIIKAVLGIDGGKSLFRSGVASGGMLFAANLVYGLAVGLGMVLLIIPGLITAAVWCVAPVVVVARSRMIGEAFKESARLTKGARWAALGLICLAFIPIFLIVFGLTYMLETGGGLAEIAASMVVDFLAMLAQTLVGSIGIAVLYLELVRRQSGAASSHVADVFD